MMLLISPYQTMMVITSAMTCFCFFLSFFFFNFFSLMMMMMKTMMILSFVTAFPETPPQKINKITILSPRLSFALFRRPKREERSADQRRRERYSTAFFRVFFFVVV
jgi:hypothetical protein